MDTATATPATIGALNEHIDARASVFAANHAKHSKRVVEEQIQQIMQKSKSNKGSSNIFVYPFSLNPEAHQPSGAVNFSKVSHATLDIHLAEPVGDPAQFAAAGTANDLQVYGSDSASGNAKGEWQVDVYALYYNWLQIKDGRALLSFA